jgi:hypothetical protein
MHLDPSAEDRHARVHLLVSRVELPEAIGRRLPEGKLVGRIMDAEEPAMGAKKVQRVGGHTRAGGYGDRTAVGRLDESRRAGRPRTLNRQARGSLRPGGLCAANSKGHPPCRGRAARGAGPTR